MTAPIAILHLDESCLGNGRSGATPGGAGGLIEARTRSGIQRRDFYLAAADTTNNQMALQGAITALEILGGKGARLRALIVSDSEYLVKGIREWAPGWAARGWRRKGGAIENLGLWQTLYALAGEHDVQWTWVRGHHGHAKNEYANDLAVGAAKRGETSDGAVASKFLEWLAAERKKKRYLAYDPDAAFTELEQRIAAGPPMPLAERR